MNPAMKTLLKGLFQPSFNPDSSRIKINKSPLQEHYRQLINQNRIRHDDAQFETLKQLQSLMHDLADYAGGRRKAPRQKRQSPASQATNCRSLYIYGPVGCGKSMLMDMFFEVCPIKQKRRVHFHVFMQEVHQYIHQWQKTNSGNPIPALAKHIRASTLLFCFDEFHVTDIADAMILGRLLSELFALGTVLVATSNRHPDELYQGGQQRELFLPFIELLKQTAEIAYLAADSDYRISNSVSVDTTYYYPLNDESEFFLQLYFAEVTDNAPMKPGAITVSGRQLCFSAIHDDVALMTFEEICMQPLAAADYLAVAGRFNTILLSGIPRFLPENRNEAKRFVTLIDILYEHKVKLICTAAVKASQLYTEGDGSFEFARTVSRLMEMRSEYYLQDPE